MTEATRLEGAIDVTTAAVRGGLATIEGVHKAIARKPFSALRIASAVGEVSEIMRVVHDGVTRLVYAGIGTVISLAALPELRQRRLARQTPNPGLARSATWQCPPSTASPANGSSRRGTRSRVR